MDALEKAREALRERQGKGARWDAPEAPAELLGWARTGTAYFARVLNHLTREELDGASLVPGWMRRHVIAEIGYQARALTRLTEWAASGVATPMFADPAQRLEEIADGATLPDRALRGLFHHAAVHLDVEWRDLTASQWDAMVAGPDGEAICVRETAWLRARCVWLRAVDLDNGGSFLDFPPALVDRLIAESAAQWTGPALTLTPTDRDAAISVGAQGGPAVGGRAADLARWITGRGARRLTHDEALPALQIDISH